MAVKKLSSTPDVSIEYPPADSTWGCSIPFVIACDDDSAKLCVSLVDSAGATVAGSMSKVDVKSGYATGVMAVPAGTVGVFALRVCTLKDPSGSCDTTPPVTLQCITQPIKVQCPAKGAPSPSLEAAKSKAKAHKSA